jgi:hypothetical protein
MTDTVNLGLPCIEGSQAQKHITHNDALRILDTLVQLAVLDRDLTAPPASPTEGQRWIVKSGATGAWAGHDNAIAAWQDGGWQFSAPQTGWCAFVADEGTLLVWNGTAWGDFFSTVTSIQNLALLGIGTTADSTNVLAAKLNNALFAAKTVAEGGDGNLRYKLNKETPANTLSFLFQDGYSGRAEIGLTGDDDFHFKVSPDGATWHEGIVVNKTTGAVTFPNTSIAGGGRDLLTANRTYYVRSDGNDGNSGLANTSGGAFLTIQKAIDSVAALDLSVYDVTIQVGSGANWAPFELKSTAGAGKVTILGDETTPANCVVTGAPTSGLCYGSSYRGRWRVSGLKFTTTSGSGAAIFITGPCYLELGKNNYGACSGGNHLLISGGAFITLTDSYTISGGTGWHIVSFSNSLVQPGGAITVTLSGTPAFAGGFALAGRAGLIAEMYFCTFSGSATGKRYEADDLGLIFTAANGANFLPGNTAGSTSGGGQYI